MSFLLGDDYASSSESESDEEEAVTTQRMDQGASTEQAAPAQPLPSADSVLSSVAASSASFLPPKSSAQPHSTVRAFDLLEERETQETLEREQKEAERMVEPRRIERKRPPPSGVTTQEQSTKREKNDAKERVKNQRVKGQAGIGSDFRGWKSETEMALRQQFD
ncbi:hypothetical protein PHYPSEUDO_008884 [Phytophthora pseudosyringae]|uniref:Uncharacterized protein n=1 Tax=Phytophthora pseudosyringae TaxID=221518 RepID=A0A8T1VG42_9STRA|nr:hypothetical protein PHYPSEUDO_008884 [Phytophthora pseudosyringae]